MTLRVAGGKLETMLSLLLLVLLAAVAIGVRPWRGETSTPLDLLAAYPGWGQQVEPDDVRNRERSDALDFFLPQWIYARERIRSGDVPLWNDTRSGGDSSFLNLTAGHLTPGFALFTLAPSPALGFYLSILFNIAVGGVGMYFFLRRNLGVLPSIFGGGMFQLCGFNAAWLYWTHVPTLAWGPWLLWAVDGAVHRRTWTWGAGVAVTTALLVLGGFPFVAELMIGAAALYALSSAFMASLVNSGLDRLAANTMKKLILPAAGILVGFFLAFLPLLAFVQWLRQFDLDGRATGSFLRIGSDLRLLSWPWAFEAPRVERSMYVGTGGALLGAAGLAMIWYRRFTAGHLSFFALMLTSLALVLMFQLLPPSALAWVPGLKGNSWARAISLLNLSLSISAAAFLHKMLIAGSERGPTHRLAAYTFVIMFVVLQCYDQVSYFRKFNGATRSEYFFPRTQLIARVQREKGPFDYVVADNGYLVSGSLGGYGIREWFAHRFRTPALRAVLPNMADKPFSSPTASSLGGAAIRSEAPEMVLFNVRYILAKSGHDFSLRRLMGVPNGKGMAPLPPLPAHSWHQPFLVEKASILQRLSIRFATYRATDVDGRVTVEITAADGRSFAKIDRDAADMRDNEYLEFRTDNTTELLQGTYGLRIDYVPGAASRKVTAWAGPAPTAGASVEVDGKPTGRILDFKMALAATDPQFIRRADDGLVSLWENGHSPNGPYFTRDLDSPVASPLDVRVERYQPERFEISYAGHDAGYIVVPMELTDDWQIRQDGRRLEDSELLMGVLPALKVDGPATLEFVYAPRVLAFGWWWLAALLTGGLLLFWWKRGRLSKRRAYEISIP